MQKFLSEAANVRPSKSQLEWFRMGAYAFVHFGVNTFTNREWGDGTEPESIFNPEKLDCDQWVSAIKSAGLTGMVLTAKHHDGFCLWPSKYTEHSVKNSPFAGDVVREAAEACRRGGIRFGVYLSPWDRNSPLYGTPAYNDYFCNQLRELLTEYGDIFLVWFDNACGEGPNGKKQVYDFPRYVRLIRSLQPNALIFNDFGPDLRWCGNEAGAARHSEWAVVPQELAVYAEPVTGPGPLSGCGSLSYIYSTDQDIGALPNILFSRGLCFAPAEFDMSIRPGWFWHEDEEPHSLERLYRTYVTTCGANAGLNLNIPPTREGLFDERDVRRLREFGELIKKEFGTPILTAEGEDARDRSTETRKMLLGYQRKAGLMELDDSDSDYQPIYRMDFPEPVRQEELRHIVLEEEISEGQRVESFQVVAVFEDGGSYPVSHGTCIGSRKILEMRDPFADQNPLTDDRRSRKIRSLLVCVTSARGPVRMRKISIC